MVVEQAVHWFHPSPPRPPALGGTDFAGLVPVVEAGCLCGLVSIGDVVKLRLEEFEAEQRALKEYIATA